MEVRELEARTTDLIGTRLQGLQRAAVGMVVAGGALSAWGFAMDQKTFFGSYLFGFMFWTGVSAGCLGLLMLHHTVGGGWGFLLRRFFEAGVRNLGLMALAAIPVIVGMMAFGLYEWNTPAGLADQHIQAKAGYLNPIFFIARNAVYFALWGFFGHKLMSLGRKLDAEPENKRTLAELNYWGAWGILFFVLSITFSSVDWVLSLTPKWMSSIVGLLFTAMSCLCAMSLMTFLLGHLAGDQPILRRIPGKYIRDLANLMLAMVMLWAYMSFSQYVITYSGNTVEETEWYLRRAGGGWGFLSLGLIVIHFVGPFLLLITDMGFKENINKLKWIGLWLVVMRHLDLYWWVAPSSRPNWTFSPADVGVPLLLGGIWLWFWAKNLADTTIVPAKDPRLVAHLGELAHG